MFLLKGFIKGFKRIRYTYLAWLWVNFSPDKKSIDSFYRVMNGEPTPQDVSLLLALNSKPYLRLSMALSQILIPDHLCYRWESTYRNLRRCLQFHGALLLLTGLGVRDDSRSAKLLRDGFFCCLNGKKAYWESYYILDEIIESVDGSKTLIKDFE